ncbi:MAG: hypothetical protein HRT90_04100, partial [Candidatus Margulisbacteria bacterium]|nr:hypothetical protein [Candidatus Margulisiibacteriota bacterium]
MSKANIEFNPEITNNDIVNNRRIINGKDDGLMQVSPLKHPFANDIYQIMIKNTWVPQEIPMGKDIEMWESADQITSNEKRVF